VAIRTPSFKLRGGNDRPWFRKEVENISLYGGIARLSRKSPARIHGTGWVSRRQVPRPAVAALRMTSGKQL
jgi:hypothetical protein